MVSLLNGLSAAGAGIAQFASTAGLEAQRADLQRQGIALAAGLQHEARSAEIEQTGTIAAAAATQEQASEMSRLQAQNASALKIAGVQAASAQAVTGMEVAGRTADVQAQLAQNKPLVDQQVAEAAIKVGMAKDQAAAAHRSYAISGELADEMSKPEDQQDTKKISTLQREMTQLNTTPETTVRFAQVLETQTRALQQQLTAANADLDRLTALQTNPLVTSVPEQAAKVNAEAEAVKQQRDSINAQLTIMTRNNAVWIQQHLPGGGTMAPPPTAGAATGAPNPAQFYTPPGGKPAPSAAAAAPVTGAPARLDPYALDQLKP